MEWSDGCIPAPKYNPTKLDCDQWVRVALDADFQYVLLVAKHHDGFCLWGSKFTDYHVASSPVKTDVVAEVAKESKKYGIKFANILLLMGQARPFLQRKGSAKIY
jgi:alpha-L-fucosidase